MQHQRSDWVTLSEMLQAAAQNHVMLGSEIAGYILLEASLHLHELGGGIITTENLAIDEQGHVLIVKSAQRSDEVHTVRALKRMLSQLLQVASSSSLALRQCISLKQEQLLLFERSLEHALIPLNRAASRRGVARLAKATLDALADGLVDLESKHDVDQSGPSLTPTVVDAPVTSSESNSTNTVIDASNFFKAHDSEDGFEVVSSLPPIVEEKRTVRSNAPAPQSVLPDRVDTSRTRTRAMRRTFDSLNIDETPHTPSVNSRGSRAWILLPLTLLTGATIAIVGSARFQAFYQQSQQTKPAPSLVAAPAPSVNLTTAKQQVCEANVHIHGRSPKATLLVKLGVTPLQVRIPKQEAFDLLLQSSGHNSERMSVQLSSSLQAETEPVLRMERSLSLGNHSNQELIPHLVPISSHGAGNMQRMQVNLSTSPEGATVWARVDSSELSALPCGSSIDFLLHEASMPDRQLRIDWSSFVGSPPVATLKL